MQAKQISNRAWAVTLITKKTSVGSDEYCQTFIYQFLNGNKAISRLWDSNESHYPQTEKT